MLFHQLLLNSVSSLQDLAELAAFAYLHQLQNSHPRNSHHLITSPPVSTQMLSITTMEPITTIIKYIITITICSNCYSLSCHCCPHRLSNRHRIDHQEGWAVNTTVIVLPYRETCHSPHLDLHLHTAQNSYHLRLLQR